MTSSDLCIGFFADVWNTGHIGFPIGASVLEIGSAEADWITPMLEARPDLQITGIDWRGAKNQRPEVIKGDVLTHRFPAAGFDAVVSISTIEHIGLGSYDDAPIDPDGDTKTMQRIAEWLKPGGVCYFDVPYRPDGPYVVHGNFRAYDPAQLAARLLVPSGLTWEYAQLFPVNNADAPYIACVLRKG